MTSMKHRLSWTSERLVPAPFCNMKTLTQTGTTACHQTAPREVVQLRRTPRELAPPPPPPTNSGSSLLRDEEAVRPGSAVAHIHWQL